MPISILLIESDPDLRKVIALSLEQEGLRIYEGVDVEDAKKILKEETPDLLVLELDFPHGKNGALVETYRMQRQGSRGDGKVVLTTTIRPGDAWRRRYQPDAVIYKPFDIRRLCEVVKTQIQGNSVATV